MRIEGNKSFPVAPIDSIKKNNNIPTPSSSESDPNYLKNMKIAQVPSDVSMRKTFETYVQGS